MSTSEKPSASSEYSAPRLVIYGGMVALTAGGSQNDTENKANQTMKAVPNPMG